MERREFIELATGALAATLLPHKPSFAGEDYMTTSWDLHEDSPWAQMTYTEKGDRFISGYLTHKKDLEYGHTVEIEPEIFADISESGELIGVECLGQDKNHFLRYRLMNHSQVKAWLRKERAK